MAKKQPKPKIKSWNPKSLDVYNQVIVDQLRTSLKNVNVRQYLTTKIWDEVKLKGHKQIFSKEMFKSLIDIRKAIGRERKNIRRALGGLLQTDPKAYAPVIQKIVEGDLKGVEVSNAIKNFQGQAKRLGGLGHYTDKITGKVGHADTGVNILLDGLEDWIQPFEGPQQQKMLAEFRDLSKKAGIQVGDEFLSYIDPAAHMPFVKKVHGMMKDRFGLNPKDIPEDLYTEMRRKMAHNSLFGGTEGFKMPVIKGLKGASAEEFFEAARPWLEMPKMNTEVAKRLDEVIKNSPNLSDADFLKAVKAVPYSEGAEELRDQLQIFRQTKPEDLMIQNGKVIAASPIDKNRLQINPAKTALKRVGTANIIGRTLTHAGRAAASPLVGPEQGEAITKLIKTGDKKYIKDLAIASGTDIAVGSAFGVGAKAIAQRQLTKGLIKKGLARAVLGTVSGPIGWGLLAYSALDTANAVTRAATGRGFVGRAKDLFIKNQDNPAKGVQIASTKYTPNPVWKMTDQDKKDHMNNMIKRWQSGEETVPLPSDISGPHMRI